MNKFREFCTRHYVKAASAVASVPVLASMAHADILTDTKTAVEGAAADALTVGGYVVAGVCSLLVIGLIIKFAGKLR